MNKVILMGRLTRDADVRYSQGEKPSAVAHFSLAVDRRVGKDQERQADFPNCVAFGKIGEFFEKYGKQGTKFVIEGRIQTGSYTNKDGQKVYTTDVVVEHAEFAESRKDNAGSGKGGSNNTNAASADGFSDAANASTPFSEAPSDGGFDWQ